MEQSRTEELHMDSIGFEKKTIHNPYADGNLILAKIIINNIGFLDIVRNYELHYARKYNQEDIAGGYEYQFANELYMQLTDRQERKVSLLICGGCLGEGCWDLVATIKEDNKHVFWKDFCNPHRGVDSPGGFWDFSNFGSLCFDKTEYRNAVAKIRQFYH